MPEYSPTCHMLEGAKKIGLTVQEMGSSEGVVIPSEWREDIGIEKGDLADAEYDREADTVTFHF